MKSSYLGRNNLMEIVVKDVQTQLRFFFLSYNHLAQLDVSKLPNLYRLDVDRNKLVKLNGLKKLSKLQKLSARVQRGYMLCVIRRCIITL